MRAVLANALVVEVVARAEGDGQGGLRPCGAAQASGTVPGPGPGTAGPAGPAGAAGAAGSAGVVSLVGDQSNATFLLGAVIAAAQAQQSPGAGPGLSSGPASSVFDLVIDDTSGKPPHLIAPALLALWPRVSPGGAYLLLRLRPELHHVVKLVATWLEGLACGEGSGSASAAASGSASGSAAASGSASGLGLGSSSCGHGRPQQHAQQVPRPGSEEEREGTVGRPPDVGAVRCVAESCFVQKLPAAGDSDGDGVGSGVGARGRKKALRRRRRA